VKQTKENTGEQIAIYSRKSKFTGKGESIENQIELCKQYIRPRYPNCNDEGILIYEDEGFSGGNMERPQFKKMMAEARAKKFSAIVCYRLDRISRNIGDFAKLIEELDGLNVSFISIKEQFDTSSPMGRVFFARTFSTKLQVIFPYYCISIFHNVATSVSLPVFSRETETCRHETPNLINQKTVGFANSIRLSAVLEDSRPCSESVRSSSSMYSESSRAS